MFFKGLGRPEASTIAAVLFLFGPFALDRINLAEGTGTGRDRDTYSVGALFLWASGYKSVLAVFMKEKAKHYQKLDFSRLDVRVRCVLRKLGVDTVGKLLALTEQDVSAIKNCGDKTTAKIITLQKEYRIPRAIVKQREMTVEGAIESSRSYIYRLITVAIAANGLIESAKGSDRYHFRVSKQRFNTLKGALEALRARQQ